jgi:hypothetical protein
MQRTKSLLDLLIIAFLFLSGYICAQNVGTWMKGTGSIDKVFPFEMAIYGTQGLAAAIATPLGNYEVMGHSKKPTNTIIIDK